MNYSRMQRQGPQEVSVRGDGTGAGMSLSGEECLCRKQVQVSSTHVGSWEWLCESVTPELLGVKTRGLQGFIGCQSSSRFC